MSEPTPFQTLRARKRADHLVDLGSIEPENVMTSGILVDYVVEGDDVEWTSQ